MRQAVVLLAAAVVLLAAAGCPPRAEAPTPKAEAGASAPASDKAAEPTFSQGVAETDEEAPKFILKDTEGNEVTKSEFLGKVLVLDFWASFCAPCKKKLKAYEPIIARYQDRGVELLAVSLDDDPKVAAAWAQQAQSPFRMVMSTPEMVKAYFPEAVSGLTIPQARIIDRDGNLRYKLGPQSTVEDLELALSKLVSESVGGDAAAGKEAVNSEPANRPEDVAAPARPTAGG